MPPTPELNPFAAPMHTDRATSAAIARSSDHGAFCAEMLRQSRPWMIVLAAQGLIGAGFGVLGLIGGALRLSRGPGTPSEQWVPLVIQATMIVIYLVASLLLFAVARHIRPYVYEQTDRALEEFLDALANFWTFCGVVTVLFVGLFAVVICAGLIAGQ